MRETLRETLEALVRKLVPRLVEIRRHLHAHPELSGEEYQTAAYVAGVLSSCGLHVREAVGRTGVVGDLLGADDRPIASDRPALAIRTDMDALPIRELADLSFASQRPGVMHACGHDLHATVGLGTAMVLSELGDALPGPVRFLFQPAEEIAQGAGWMVADGAMDGVAAILGLHVYPSIPGGSVGIRYGALTAAADDVEIEILGESGHGARPHEATDAIWIAAQVVTALQQAIARTQNPLRPLVLTLGQIEGGRAPNVIADRVLMRGTARSLHPETREGLPGWIERIATQICATYGAKAEVRYRPGVPSVQNAPDLTQLLETAAREAIGADRVLRVPEPSLGAEDFSVYLDRAPGTMFRLGTGWPDRPNPPLHHPKFDPDERAIAVGVSVLAWAAWRYWERAARPAAAAAR